MEQAVQILTYVEPLRFAWRVVAWACVAYLLILGALIFIRPAIVHRFFGGLASSWRVNFLEAVLRLVAGLAFVAVSRETKFPVAVFWCGAVLAVTAVPLMFLHQLHRAQAAWVLPLTRRFLPVMGIVAIALGGLIAWVMT